MIGHEKRFNLACERIRRLIAEGPWAASSTSTSTGRPSSWLPTA